MIGPRLAQMNLKKKNKKYKNIKIKKNKKINKLFWRSLSNFRNPYYF
jgi:hypothetical protein